LFCRKPVKEYKVCELEYIIVDTQKQKNTYDVLVTALFEN